MRETRKKHNEFIFERNRRQQDPGKELIRLTESVSDFVLEERWDTNQLPMTQLIVFNKETLEVLREDTLYQFAILFCGLVQKLSAKSREKLVISSMSYLELFLLIKADKRICDEVLITLTVLCENEAVYADSTFQDSVAYMISQFAQVLIDNRCVEHSDEFMVMVKAFLRNTDSFESKEDLLILYKLCTNILLEDNGKSNRLIQHTLWVLNFFFKSFTTSRFSLLVRNEITKELLMTLPSAIIRLDDQGKEVGLDLLITILSFKLCDTHSLFANTNLVHDIINILIIQCPKLTKLCMKVYGIVLEVNSTLRDQVLEKNEFLYIVHTMVDSPEQTESGLFLLRDRLALFNDRITDYIFHNQTLIDRITNLLISSKDQTQLYLLSQIILYLIDQSDESCLDSNSNVYFSYWKSNDDFTKRIYELICHENSHLSMRFNVLQQYFDDVN